jgi:hypothetical protein
MLWRKNSSKTMKNKVLNNFKYFFLRRRVRREKTKEALRRLLLDYFNKSKLDPVVPPITDTFLMYDDFMAT